MTLCLPKSLCHWTLRKRTSKGKSMLMSRKQGPASLRKAPENAPAWALNNVNEGDE